MPDDTEFHFLNILMFLSPNEFYLMKLRIWFILVSGYTLTKFANVCQRRLYFKFKHLSWEFNIMGKHSTSSLGVKRKPNVPWLITNIAWLKGPQRLLLSSSNMHAPYTTCVASLKVAWSEVVVVIVRGEDVLLSVHPLVTWLDPATRSKSTTEWRWDCKYLTVASPTAVPHKCRARSWLQQLIPGWLAGWLGYFVPLCLPHNDNHWLCKKNVT